MFCGKVVQSKAAVSARCHLIVVSMLPMFGSCKQLTQDTNINKSSYHCAWFHHRNMASLPRSRLAEHGEHPAHFVHLHFFSQLCELVAHQGLQSPVAWELVVVVIGFVVVMGFSWHEQQGSPVLSFVHLSHSKDPPCATQALMSLSSSHVGSGVVGEGVGAGVVGAEVDVHGTGGIHVHLPSLAK